MTNSKLEFRVYNEQASPREIIGQASVDLFSLLQKHRYKSTCFSAIRNVYVCTFKD